VVIAFTYAVIAPVILPVAAVYFLGCFIVFKKQILFAYTTQYESGGKSFSSALNRTLVGLICGQVTLIGYTVLRAGLYQVRGGYCNPGIALYPAAYTSRHL
jgi:hypothetical protein